MRLFNPGGGTGSHPRARAQRLEMLMGVLGFFTVMALVQAVVLEVRGEPAGLAAAVLAVLLLLLGLVVRARRNVRL